MNSTRLTLIARSFGVELPMEVHKKIMAGTVEKLPFALELGNSSIEMLNSPTHYPTRPGSGNYHLDYGRVESMARAVKVGALELGAPCARNYAFTRAQVIENPHLLPVNGIFEFKLHPAQRRSQQSFDLKTLAIDMVRYQTGNRNYIYDSHYKHFDGDWIGLCGGKFKANLRKFEFQNMWPTLYGKGGWAK